MEARLQKEKRAREERRERENESSINVVRNSDLNHGFFYNVRFQIEWLVLDGDLRPRICIKSFVSLLFNTIGPRSIALHAMQSDSQRHTSIRKEFCTCCWLLTHTRTGQLCMYERKSELLSDLLSFALWHSNWHVNGRRKKFSCSYQRTPRRGTDELLDPWSIVLLNIARYLEFKIKREREGEQRTL